ncbi:unnamed protein product, partial [Ectocarpus sp. 8 AP-2014]
MGLLDKLKESFGADDKPKSFEVTFVEQHLGISLSPGPHGESRVTGVTNGGAAAKAGVRVNDAIAAIDGNASPVAHEDLVDVIRAIGRPAVIRFHRSGGGGTEGEGAGARAQEPGPFQRAQDAAWRKIDEIKGPPQ